MTRLVNKNINISLGPHLQGSKGGGERSMSLSHSFEKMKQWQMMDLKEKREWIENGIKKWNQEGAEVQSDTAETDADRTLGQAENETRFERPQRIRRKPARYRDENFV